MLFHKYVRQLKCQFHLIYGNFYPASFSSFSIVLNLRPKRKTHEALSNRHFAIKTNVNLNANVPNFFQLNFFKTYLQNALKYPKILRGDFFNLKKYFFIG